MPRPDAHHCDPPQHTPRDAEFDGDLRNADVIEALEALTFRTAGSRHTLRIDREIKLLLLDALRRRV
jgi:hypothetical protein